MERSGGTCSRDAGPRRRRRAGMKKVIVIALVVAAGLAAVALAGVGLPTAAHGDAGITRTITVNGNGTVKVTPGPRRVLVRGRFPGRHRPGGERRQRPRDAAPHRRAEGRRHRRRQHPDRPGLGLAGHRQRREGHRLHRLRLRLRRDLREPCRGDRRRRERRRSHQRLRPEPDRRRYRPVRGRSTAPGARGCEAQGRRRRGRRRRQRGRRGQGRRGRRVPAPSRWPSTARPRRPRPRSSPARSIRLPRSPSRSRCSDSLRGAPAEAPPAAAT